MNISDGNETVDIPPAPRPTGAPAINVSHVPSNPELSPNSSSPVPAPFKAYVPQPTAPPMTPVVASTTLNNYYAQKPPPNLSRPPVANNDPRVEDTVELCNFAILALKVCLYIIIIIILHISTYVYTWSNLVCVFYCYF